MQKHQWYRHSGKTASFLGVSWKPLYFFKLTMSKMDLILLCTLSFILHYTVVHSRSYKWFSPFIPFFFFFFFFIPSMNCNASWILLGSEIHSTKALISTELYCANCNLNCRYYYFFLALQILHQFLCRTYFSRCWRGLWGLAFCFLTQSFVECCI